MKKVAKIIAYCVWFVVTLALSVLFFRLVVWIENRAGIFSAMRFWIMLLSWFGFVVVVAWVPVWFLKKRASDSGRLIARTAMFLIMMLACTIFSEIIWDTCFAGKIYNCTDDNLGGFFKPGGWVHDRKGVPVMVVAQITPHDTMDKPDTIKEGWSVPKLWLLWWSFIAASIAISASLTFLIFPSRKLIPAQTVSS